MKLFFTGLLTFLLSTGILYFIGYAFHIEWLMFHFFQPGNSKDIIFTAGGSLLPVVIGIIIAVMAEGLLYSKKSSISGF